MNIYYFLGIIFIGLWFLAIFLGFIRTVPKGFANDPTANAYHSADTRRNISDKAFDVQEKNRRLMEDLKSKQDRMRY